MRKLTLTLFSLLIAVLLMAQAPSAFKYQTVVRDAAGNAMTSANVDFQISILETSATGPAVYVEMFSTSTNQFGLVNLEIGNGTIISGDIANVNWAGNLHFVKIEVDIFDSNGYQEMGTSQLLSVPYALNAKTAENAFSGDYYDLSNQPTIPTQTSDLINNSSFVTTSNDADADSTNEIQILSISNDTVYLSNGGFAKLPAAFSGDYNDLLNVPTPTGDVTGAIDNNTVEKIQGMDVSANIPANGQVLKWNSTTSTWMPNDDALGAAGTTDGVVSSIGVTGTGTKTITLQRINVSGDLTAIFTDEINDADANPTNEIQILSISNDTIYLSDGGFVELPTSFSGDYNDLTNAPTNISHFTNDAGYITNANDADADPTNEIQILSISNDTIYLSDGGFAKLPAGFSGDYNDLTSAPTNVSHFTNDAGYITNPDDADADNTNELQTLSQTGSSVTLSNGGGTITVADNDDDSSNEIQTISKSGSTVTLSDGGGTFTDAVDDADADNTNELQDISISGHDVSITNGSTITIPDNIDDADADATNEIQDLDLTGNTLSITNNASATNIDLSGYTNLWQENGNDIYYDNGYVGVGVTDPNGKLIVKSDASIDADTAIFEVKNKNGQTVFAVYEEGVRIYVDDSGTKANSSKGGFAVGGFSAAKSAYGEYLRVTPDSVRVYIESSANSSKGGFAVGGFSAAKTIPTPVFNVGPAASANIINPSDARIAWYPLKEAFLAGRVLVEHEDSVGTNSFSTGFESRAKGDYSQAFGFHARAAGDNSTAIGNYANAKGEGSFAFGDSTIALGKGSFAFGNTGEDTITVPGSSFTRQTIARGDHSFALGFGALADSSGSIAMGAATAALGSHSVAIGLWDTTYAPLSFAVGLHNKTYGLYSTALGNYNETRGNGAFAVGSFNKSDGDGATTFGTSCVASADGAFAIGISDTASGAAAIAIGYETVASGGAATSFGYQTTANGRISTAFGRQTEASGSFSTAFGYLTTASGNTSVAFGYQTIASGSYSTTFGRSTTASGSYSAAFGHLTTASGDYSTSFGYQTVASAPSSSAFGYLTTASGFYSTAFGRGINVSGDFSFGIALDDMSSTTLSQDNSMAIMGGKVGIGTVTPLYNLNVIGDGAGGANGTMMISATSVNNDATLYFSEISSNFYNMSITYDGGLNQMLIKGDDGTTERTHISIHRNSGNLGMGTIATTGSNVFALYNGDDPTSSITDGVLLFADYSSAELRVRDEAGNVTTLSPHNFSFTEKSEPMAWSFFSENEDIGYKINVDMLKAIRVIEQLSGEELVYLKDFNTDKTIANHNANNSLVKKVEDQQEIINELLKRIEKLEDKTN